MSREERRSDRKLTVVEFLYDFASPNCYVANCKLQDIAARRKVEIRLVPLFLGGLFKMTNDAPVSRGTNEYNYMVSNLERLSKALNVEFNFPHSSFPINSVRALRGAYFAESAGKTNDYVSRVFAEHWVRGADISDFAVLGRLVESVGMDRGSFLEFIEKEETKLRLRKETEDAFQRGVFGSPTYFVDGEMYWGTPEVLWLLDEELGRAGSKEKPPAAGGLAARSREMLEERTRALTLAEEARRKIDGLSPEAAVELYGMLKSKSITELTEEEYAERLVLAERLSAIMKDLRKQKR